MGFKVFKVFRVLRVLRVFRVLREFSVFTFPFYSPTIAFRTRLARAS